MVSMQSNKSTPVMVRLSPDQTEAVDQWRRKQRDIPTRPEAIRQLVELGLENTKPRQKEKA